MKMKQSGYLLWGINLSLRLLLNQILQEREKIVKTVEAIANSRNEEDHKLDDSQKFEKYREYLKEECQIGLLEATRMSLGGNGEQPLQLDKDPVKNRKALLERSKMLVDPSLNLDKLTKGDITQTKLEDQLIRSLQYRIQKLSGGGEQPLQLDEDPVENRKALLELAKRIRSNPSLGLDELTKGNDKIQECLEDRLIKSLHNRIQKLSGDSTWEIVLDNDPVENRKALLKRARMMTPRSSLEKISQFQRVSYLKEIVKLTPQKMSKLKYLNRGKWALRQEIVNKIEGVSSKGLSKVRQGSKIASNKRR